MAKKPFAATTVELPEITLVGMKVATNMERGKIDLTGRVECVSENVCSNIFMTPRAPGSQADEKNK